MSYQNDEENPFVQQQPSGIRSSVMSVDGYGEFKDRLRDPKFVLRLVDPFLVIIALSCAASVQWAPGNAPYSAFFITIQIFASIFDLFFMYYYMKGYLLPQNFADKIPGIEAIISFFMTFLSFAAATALAAKSHQFDYTGHQSTINAACTFGFFSSLVWAASTYLASKRALEPQSSYYTT